MAELRDLECGPIAGRQRRDQAGDHTGLAHVSRMPADHDNSHDLFELGLFLALRFPQLVQRCQALQVLS